MHAAFSTGVASARRAAITTVDIWTPWRCGNTARTHYGRLLAWYRPGIHIPEPPAFLLTPGSRLYIRLSYIGFKFLEYVK